MSRPLADADVLPVNFEVNVRRQIDAALAKALEENNTYFQAERERLDQWAEDQLLSAEQALQSQQRRQRREIFDVEDEIEAKRDGLIAALERRLNQRSHSLRLFRMRWVLA